MEGSQTAKYAEFYYVDWIKFCLKCGGLMKRRFVYKKCVFIYSFRNKLIVENKWRN